MWPFPRGEAGPFGLFEDDVDVSALPPLHVLQVGRSAERVQPSVSVFEEVGRPMRLHLRHREPKMDQNDQGIQR